MIFKTIEDDLGKTKFAINDTFKSLFNGSLFKGEKLLSDDDIKALQAYNAEIERGVSPMTAYYRTMQDASDAAVNMAQSAGKGTVQINNMTKASKAAKIGMQALATVGNMFLGMAISWGISKFIEFTQVSENVAEKARELGSSFSNSKNEIADYKTKIEDLYKTINDGSSSIEEVKTARQELLKVQDAMIEKYGDEQTSINLVTEAISGQVNALDELTSRQWQQSKNEFNNGDFVNDLNNFLNGYKDNLERMEEEYGNYTVSLRLSSSIIGNTDLEELFKEKYGATIIKNDDVGTMAQLTGNATELHELLLKIQDTSEDLIPNHLAKQLTDAANEAKNVSDEYKDIYNQYVLYEKILPDENMSAVWLEANQAYNDYQEALVSGEQDAIYEAARNYSSVLANTLESENVDEAIVTFFRNMHPTIQSELDKIDFQASLSANYDTSVFENLTDAKMLENINDTEFQYYGESTFNQILADATELEIVQGDYNQRVQQLLDLLVQWGILQGTITDEMQNPDEIRDLMPTISSSVQQIATQLEPQFAKLGEAYKNIFTEDGVNANVVDNTMLEGLRQTFAELESDLGVSFDTVALEQFFSVLGSGEFAAQEAQEAFNDLATSWFYSTEVLGQLDKTTAEAITQQLEQMGVTNADEIVGHHLKIIESSQELISLQEQLSSARQSLAQSSNNAEKEASEAEISSIYNKIQAYYDEIGVTEEVRIALFNLQMQELGLSATQINTASDCQQLIQLAQTAGLSAEYIEKLVYLEQLWNSYHSTTNAQMQNAIYQKIQQVQNELAEGLEPSELELQFDPNTTEAVKAGGDAGDAYVEAFEKELEKLQDLRDRGKITEKDYLDQLRVLYTKYFADRKEYLDEFEKYEYEYLKGMKDLHESALDSITSLIDDQIDLYEEQKEAAIAVYEEQKKAIDEEIEGIEKQISIKQEQIDKINEAKEQRQAEIDAAKKLYELEKAQSQRSIQTLKDGQRVYTNDPYAVRDAQVDVDDSQDELRIRKIEKEISLLEKRKSSLEEQKDALDKMIDSTEEYWDSLIKGLENYKSRWEELKEIEERARIENDLKQLGISTEDILNMSEEAFQEYKNNYLNILADIYSGNDSMLESLSNVTGLDFSSLNGYLAETSGYIKGLTQLDVDKFNASLAGMGEGFDGVDKSAQNLADTLSNGGASSGEQNEEQNTTSINKSLEDVKNSAEEMGKETPADFEKVLHGAKDLARAIGTKGTGSALGKKDNKESQSESKETNGESSESVVGAIEAVGDTGGTVLPQVGTLFNSLNDEVTPVKDSIETLKEILEQLDGKEFSVTLNVNGASGLNFFGGVGTSGTGFATGTSGLSHDEKNAIRSEYNQKELTIFPDGHYELTNTPTISDLPKGTVIYDEKDTNKILNGNKSISGKTYVNGTNSLPSNLVPLEIADPEKFKMLNRLQNATFSPFSVIEKAFEMQTKQIEATVKQAIKVSLQNNTPPSNVDMSVNITCPNVTNDSGIHYIEKELGNLTLKGLQYFKTK